MTSNLDPAAATARWLATLSPEDTARAIRYTQGGHWLSLLGKLAAAIGFGHECFDPLLQFSI